MRELEGIKIHPAAEIFPMMNEEDLNALAEDIRQKGQQESVVFYKDQLIDGRNRWVACHRAGDKPDIHTITYDGLDVTSHVLSLNLHRRHLTTSQRAVVAAKLEEFYAAEAKERQGTRTDIVATLPQCSAGKARDKAGEAMSVSSRLVGDAKAVREQGSPELVAAVESGEVTVSRAARIAKTEPKESQLAEATRPRKAAKTPKKPKTFADIVDSQTPPGSVWEEVYRGPECEIPEGTIKAARIRDPETGEVKWDSRDGLTYMEYLQTTDDGEDEEGVSEDVSSDDAPTDFMAKLVAAEKEGIKSIGKIPNKAKQHKPLPGGEHWSLDGAMGDVKSYLNNRTATWPRKELIPLVELLGEFRETFARRAAQGKPVPADETPEETLERFDEPFEGILKDLENIQRRYNRAVESSTYATKHLSQPATNGFLTGIKRAKESLELDRPKAVCNKCGGEGCRRCASLGVISQHKYNRETREKK